jgi:hypothetical protein
MLLKGGMLHCNLKAKVNFGIVAEKAFKIALK